MPSTEETSAQNGEVVVFCSGSGRCRVQLRSVHYCVEQRFITSLHSIAPHLTSHIPKRMDAAAAKPFSRCSHPHLQYHPVQLSRDRVLTLLHHNKTNFLSNGQARILLKVPSNHRQTLIARRRNHQRGRSGRDRVHQTSMACLIAATHSVQATSSSPRYKHDRMPALSSLLRIVWEKLVSRERCQELRSRYLRGTPRSRSITPFHPPRATQTTSMTTQRCAIN